MIRFNVFPLSHQWSSFRIALVLFFVFSSNLRGDERADYVRAPLHENGSSNSNAGRSQVYSRQSTRRMTSMRTERTPSYWCEHHTALLPMVSTNTDPR